VPLVVWSGDQIGTGVREIVDGEYYDSVGAAGIKKVAGNGPAGQIGGFFYDTAPPLVALAITPRLGGPVGGGRGGPTVVGRGGGGGRGGPAVPVDTPPPPPPPSPGGAPKENPPVIYREGRPSPSNLTPRPTDNYPSEIR
jgi:hypothetical protein